MILVKICLIWLSIQEKAFLTDAGFKFYTSEGSTMNFNVKAKTTQTYIGYHGKSYNKDYQRVKTNRYDIVLRPNVLEFQIIDVTASDEGLYWFDFDWNRKYQFQLKITNMTCPSSPIERVCAIAGSSPMIRHSFDFPVYHRPIDKHPYKRRNSNRFIINQMHADLQIYNVTREDEGFYDLDLSTVFDRDTVHQLVYIWFINQTEIHTIIGQEGKEMEINCSTNNAQYIAALKIELNESILAIGDNKSVSFSFIPKRTDHLTVYTCVDITHSSIMITVTLIIRYAPAVTLHYTNGTLECDCDGFPPVYSVYRLNRISKYGEIVYSINLNNETFIFNTDKFPYLRNGRYMCVVSNGMPDTNGKELQYSSTHVNYKGPPVFAKENIYVHHGNVGQSSIRMSFLVYSCPDIEEIFLQKLGRMRGKKRKLHKYVLKSTVLYNELDNETGVPGYYILVESYDLDIEDFQAYIITIQNRLGASDYQFEIIKKEDREIDQREKKYVFTICIIAAVLFGSIIIHVGLCVNRARLRVPIHSNINEDRTYHTYDEIGTILYGAVSNERPSETDDNQGQIPAYQHEAHISNEVNVQSPNSYSIELNTDFPNEDLQQRGVNVVQEQPMSLSTDDAYIIDNKEQTSDRKSQNSSDSDSESPHTVIVGNDGDGYENSYQNVLLDRPEGHQYTQITIEKNTSIVSADSDCEMQLPEHSLTKEAIYINLQF